MYRFNFFTILFQELKSVLEWKYGQKFRNSTGFEAVIQGILIDKDQVSACGDYRRKTEQIPQGY